MDKEITQEVSSQNRRKAIVITLISVAVLMIFKELTGFLPLDFKKIKSANSVLF
jgi:hypothetical protein